MPPYMFNARSGLPSIYLAHVSQPCNFLRSLRQLSHNTAMCECLGCSGCQESRKGKVGKCDYHFGKRWADKEAKRCHWCSPHNVSPVVVANADTTHVPAEVADAVTTHVPATEFPTRATSARPRQVMDASNDLCCQVMQPNMQHHGLAPVEDPLATKFALIGFPPLDQSEIPADWLVRPLSHETPHVFLLSGPDEECKAQRIAASNMFEQLGWEPKLIEGIGSNVKLPHPRSHWAWACSLIPKLIRIIKASDYCSDDDVVLFGEDSCWPTTSCTPQQVRAWMEDALRQGYQGMWIGAGGALRKRNFFVRVNSHGQQEDQACEAKAPCGCKLFAVTLRQCRLMEKVWGWVPRDWTVDAVHQLLASSGQLMVRDHFLAASMKHFSLRCGQVFGKHVNIKLLGTLLHEGHSVEPFVYRPIHQLD